jgi:hypothetical protein
VFWYAGGAEEVFQDRLRFFTQRRRDAKCKLPFDYAQGDTDQVFTRRKRGTESFGKMFFMQRRRVAKIVSLIANC